MASISNTLKFALQHPMNSEVGVSVVWDCVQLLGDQANVLIERMIALKAYCNVQLIADDFKAFANYTGITTISNLDEAVATLVEEAIIVINDGDMKQVSDIIKILEQRRQTRIRIVVVPTGKSTQARRILRAFATDVVPKEELVDWVDLLLSFLDARKHGE